MEYCLAVVPSYVIAIDTLGTPLNSSIKLLQEWVLGQVRWKADHPGDVIRVEALVHVPDGLVVD